MSPLAGRGALILRALVLALVLQCSVAVAYWHWGDEMSLHGGSAPGWAIFWSWLIESPGIATVGRLDWGGPEWMPMVFVILVSTVAWTTLLALVQLPFVRGRGLTSA